MKKDERTQAILKIGFGISFIGGIVFGILGHYKLNSMTYISFGLLAIAAGIIFGEFMANGDDDF